MTRDVQAINAFLQAEMARRGVDCVTAVEAARWLDHHGLLRDSQSRPGKPLRDLLRARQINGQKQELNARWSICRVDHDLQLGPVRKAPSIPQASEPTRIEIGSLVAQLRNPKLRLPARDWPGELQDIHLPGLYAMWVDADGAADLSAGLGLRIGEGLIYAGQAGAGGSAATLRSRIGSNHIRGNVYGSTFRWTLAAILEHEIGLTSTGRRRMDSASELLLTTWIAKHLAIAAVPLSDRLALLAQETDVLRLLDPPLNIQGMPPSEHRTRLSALRSSFGRLP